MKEVFLYINPIKIFVALTLAHALACLDTKNTSNKLLMAIISICFLTELAYTMIYWIWHTQINTLTSISMLLHHTLWILLAMLIFGKKKYAGILLLLFWLFTITSMVAKKGFSYYPFALGGFTYLLIFIVESFKNLKKENIALFVSEKYVLLCAPLLFFFGLGLMFSFDTKRVTSAKTIFGIELYDLIIYYVNAFYYALINIYIMRTKKIRQWKVKKPLAS